MSTHTEATPASFPYPPVIPYLTLSDATAALSWYKRAFDAEVKDLHYAEDGKRVMHATVLVAGGVVMLCDEFPEFMGGRKQNPMELGGSGVTVQMHLSNVDAVWEKAVAEGAQVEMPLADQFWGDRYGVLRDPFGHRWALFTHKPAPEHMGKTW
ncbi:MAG TPA: VOC family protein [Pseudomonadota bacterium]|jgi:PhnB protein|nr:VOC family protein [Pseudomonadota bacterium]